MSAAGAPPEEWQLQDLGEAPHWEHLPWGGDALLGESLLGVYPPPEPEDVGFLEALLGFLERKLDVVLDLSFDETCLAVRLGGTGPPLRSSDFDCALFLDCALSLVDSRVDAV